MKVLYKASDFAIQPHWVIPFIILGMIGLLLIWKHKKPFFKLLGALCLGVCAVVAIRFCVGYMQIIFQYNQGNYSSITGYVENFVPASSGGETNEDSEEESFDIKGVHFLYGDHFIKKFGYHLPSTQSGFIKRDGQYLKVGYIRTDSGNVIVRIEERKEAKTKKKTSREKVVKNCRAFVKKQWPQRYDAINFSKYEIQMVTDEMLQTQGIQYVPGMRKAKAGDYLVSLGETSNDSDSLVSLVVSHEKYRVLGYLNRVS